MNNLLRTLTESQFKPGAGNTDLKLLLTSVKEFRRSQSHDTKLSDPFYETLEGLLVDLKTVSIDNHDAEAFLKPVLKAEVPDYYDVISNPMDFQTMLKKVKQRQYKSKKEFKDDLDLIWSNCFTYNASENHPLRKCAQRLKIKSEKLLANITDRKERTDPPIPPELSSNPSSLARIKLNGHVLTNGRSYTRSPSITKTALSSKVSTPTPGKAIVKIPRRDLPFSDSPAIVRTAEGMAMFRELDRSFEAGPSTQVIDRLRELAPHVEYEPDPETSDVEVKEEIDEAVALGDKRKLNGFSPDNRPHKRARLNASSAASTSSTYDKALPLWWAASQSDYMLANALPEIPYASSSSSSSRKVHPFSLPALPSNPTNSSHPTQTQRHPSHPNQLTKRKKRRKRPYDVEPYRPEDHPKALLSLMNNNVKTMKRIRHAHAKFSALGITKDLGAAGDDDADNTNANAPNAATSGAGTSGGNGNLGAPLGTGVASMDVDDVEDDQVDERPWRVPMRNGKKVSGIELGAKNAEECLKWADGKVLEHAGFQGTSKAALDVLYGVTSEYLLNVGRTIRFLCDKFSNTMTAEEIILHTLFESGTSRIQDLERYISDDVERYGSRLGDLEKKLVGAYREATAVEVLEDEGLFEEEDEEEASALALGEFGDNVGLDYFGLKELGIADEFGLSSLTIPKRLLKGKKRRNIESSPAAKPTEPPPPFPPPPPLVPLSSDKISEQIGLLQSYYSSRVATLAPPPPPPVPVGPPPLAGPSIPTIPGSLSGPTIPPLSGPSIPSLSGPSIPPLSGPTIPPLSGPTLSSPTVPPPPPGPQLHPTPTPTQTSTPILTPSVPPTQVITSSSQSSQYSTFTATSVAPAPTGLPPKVVLPDDMPAPVQAKMGPLGQILKPNASQATSKKKAKGAAGAGPGPVSASASGEVKPLVNGTGIGGAVTAANGVPGSDGPGAGTGAGAAPKKKKGVTGVGNGNGRKKKLMEAAQAQAQQAQQGQGYGQGQGQGQNQNQGPSAFPPAVTASA
ncbi:hypothetical protein D9758_010777 [Tetrapyrgos nigripes]|uniref:Bromo domain-containing protein n=1 Tax=Tetrapyrgos nigripes TaxID=182062 RepID=A0A8H5D8V0_9AGAR|nr:hypothetical protein D9758_010777 [Tetrapyrgos nigripes]